ncbi:hypothetical protein COOONC_21253 [Cooperia oncophora]
MVERMEGDELFAARVEERSPLFSIKLPEKFLRWHQFLKLNLDSNVNRLVSTKDVGMTLMDLARMNLSSLDVPVAEQEDTLKAVSLLRAAHAIYRSCDDANIPPYLCLCMDEKALLSDQYTKLPLLQSHEKRPDHLGAEYQDISK